MNFCTNADYIHTQNDLQSSRQHCSPIEHKQQYVNSHNYQSYQPPHNYGQQVISQRQISKVDRIQKRQIKKISTLERNQKIAAILTVVIAFSQKIQQIKQKICGYPSYSFTPQKYYEMLDLNDKNYVDFQDVSQFVNNPKVKDKDICALFKRMNSNSNANNTKLTYLGYLNLLKPFMNQQLARDLLLRDTISKARKANKSDKEQISSTFLQPTQESILLLFQQLMLLHCICSTQHESAKQLLMEQQMLNTKQIYQIIGFGNQRKGCLIILWEFISKNSQFQVDLTQMRYLLSFLKCHQFSLKSQACLTELFLPSNVSLQILRKKKNETAQLIEDISAENHYYNTYLKKQNLLSTQNNLAHFIMKKTNQNMDGYSSKPNFLQFVHPQSIKRLDNTYKSKQDRKIKIEQKNVQVLINPTNNSYNNVKNSSYFMRDSNNMKLNNQNMQNVSKKFSLKENNRSIQNDLKNNQVHNISGPGIVTPLLQQFMKQSNIKRNMAENTKKSMMDNQRMNDYYTKPHNYSQQNSMVNSQSAFQVVDYAYQAPTSAIKQKHSYVISHNKRQKQKDNGLQSRYNMVISQYHNHNDKNVIDPDFMINQGNQNKPNNIVSQTNNNKYNHINSIGMSHSKIVPNQSLAKSGILDAFLKNY